MSRRINSDSCDPVASALDLVNKRSMILIRRQPSRTNHFASVVANEIAEVPAALDIYAKISRFHCSSSPPALNAKDNRQLESTAEIAVAILAGGSSCPC